MANDKIKIAFDSTYFIVVETSDEKYLIVDKKGYSRIAIDGKGILRIIKEIFNIDAHIS